jgi:uncharacterized membrane protein
VIPTIVYGLLAVVVALLVHLTSVLAMPWLAVADGYARLGALVKENEIVLLSAREIEANLPYSDPAVAVAACRYVLDKGPVRVRVNTASAAMSVTFLRKGVGPFQSYSDRAATQGVLEMVIATPDQLRQMTALDADDEPVQEIRVVSIEETGLVLVRAVVPLPSRRAEIEALVASTTCEGESLER